MAALLECDVNAMSTPGSGDDKVSLPITFVISPRLVLPPQMIQAPTQGVFLTVITKKMRQKVVVRRLRMEQGQSPPRKHQCVDFPWSYAHEWESGDPTRERGRRQCSICKKWCSPATNAQGCNVPLSVQNQITLLRQSCT